MQSISRFLGAATAMLLATVGSAHAVGGPFNVPEPGSIALVGLAVGVMVLVTRRKK